MNKVQKIREEVERLQNELVQEREKGYGSDEDDACILELENVLTYIDSLQEEPISEDLDEAARKAGQKYFPDEYNIWARPNYEAVKVEYAFKEGAKWQEEHLIGKMEQFLYEELSNGDIECRDMKSLIKYFKSYMKEN